MYKGPYRKWGVDMFSFSLYPFSTPNCMSFKSSILFSLFLSLQTSFCAPSPTFTWSVMNALKWWPHPTTTTNEILQLSSPGSNAPSLVPFHISLQRAIYYLSWDQASTLAQPNYYRDRDT